MYMDEKMLSDPSGVEIAFLYYSTLKILVLYYNDGGFFLSAIKMAILNPNPTKKRGVNRCSLH